MLLCIDPGTARTGWVVMREYDVIAFGVVKPEAEMPWLRDILVKHAIAEVVIEQVQSYGRAVGQSVIDTACLGGYIAGAVSVWQPWSPIVWIKRTTVKAMLCRTARANDAQVRVAVFDRYGGGRGRAVGTKAKPGPLYGVKADALQAVALGIAKLEGAL